MNCKGTAYEIMKLKTSIVLHVTNAYLFQEVFGDILILEKYPQIDFRTF